MNPTEMHSVALRSLINDMKHVLNWLAIGLFGMAIANVIHLVGYLARHDWIGCGFDVLLAAVFAAASCETVKRGRKYGQGRA